MKTIHVREIVGQNAISMQSGSFLYEKIYSDIISKNLIELDFEGVELFASPFFNSSIGLLLKDVEIKNLQSSLKVSNLSEVGRQLLNHVIDNAIKFYGEDNKRISDALKSAQDDFQGEKYDADKKSK
jgi:hypothetical protein